MRTGAAAKSGRKPPARTPSPAGASGIPGRAALYLAIAALVSAASLAMTLGLADAARSRAEFDLGLRGDVIRAPLTPERIARALESYALAQRLDPLRPDFPASLGDMHVLLAAELPVWNAEAKAHHRAALEHYRAAISRRPSWPYTWVNLAAVKFRLAELDREFFSALERAAMLGPWEPQIQKTVADLGLAAWEVLPEETRAQVRANLDRGIHRQGEAVVRLALRHRRTELVAPLVQGDAHLEAVLKTGLAAGGRR